MQVGGKNEFSFGHVEIEVSLRHPSCYFGYESRKAMPRVYVCN